MSDENQQEEPKSAGQGPFSMRPEDVADHLAAIAAENKGPKTLQPNRTELLTHLQAIFNEAREDRRSYRALRPAFSTAVGVVAILQSNIFSTIQSTSDALTSLFMLGLLTVTSLKTNIIVHRRMAELTRTGRLADERIRAVSQSSNNTFDAKEFVTYLELFDLACEQLKQRTEAAGSDETRLMTYSLTAALFISSSGITWQLISPRESQHVIVDNISKEQHIVIDKMPKPDNERSSCSVKARADKKGKIIFEMDCQKPEPPR